MCEGPECPDAELKSRDPEAASTFWLVKIVRLGPDQTIADDGKNLLRLD